MRCFNKSIISVVIPVYNAEMVIERIVRQVLAQTYANLELIIVDDGSRDKTGAVIDRLALEDKRMRVFHTPNGGVSKARNKGIKEAKGKYITFVDADDEITPDYLVHMISAIERYSCELVISGYWGIPDKGICLDDKYYDEIHLNELMLIRNLGITFCKVNLTEIIQKYCIEFPVGMKLSEDAVFYYRYLRYVNGVVTVSNRDYFYYLPIGDSKYSLSFQNELCSLKAMQDAIISLLQERTFSSQVVERLHQRVLIILWRVVVSILAHDRAQRAKLYTQIDWPILLPMMKMNVVFKTLIRWKLFGTFDLLRGIWQRVTGKDLSLLLGVDIQ